MFHFVSLLLVVVLVGVMDVMTKETAITLKPYTKYQFNNTNYPDEENSTYIMLILYGEFPIKLNCSRIGVSKSYCKDFMLTVYDSNNTRSFCNGPFELVTETKHVTLEYQKPLTSVKSSFFCEFETKHLKTCTLKEFIIDFFIKKSMKCLKQ